MRPLLSVMRIQGICPKRARAYSPIRPSKSSGGSGGRATLRLFTQVLFSAGRGRRDWVMSKRACPIRAPRTVM